MCPALAGAVRGLPDGGREHPVRGWILGVPRGPCAGGSRPAAAAGGARAPAPGGLCLCPSWDVPLKGVPGWLPGRVEGAALGLRWSIFAFPRGLGC